MPHAPSGNALNDAPTNVCLGSDTMEVRPVEVYETDDDEEVGHSSNSTGTTGTGKRQRG